MKSRKTALAIAFIGALCSGSYVLGQQDQLKTPAQKEYMLALTRAKNVGNDQDYADLASAYTKAPKDAAVVMEIIRAVQTTDEELDKTDGLIVLSSLQAAQNQRIIELLENLNEKKKAE